MVIYGYNTITMLWSMMSYFAQLTGEDSSRYLNNKNSMGRF